MPMTRDSLQANANYVSMLLNHRSLTRSQLHKMAQLSYNELNSAIGWLICENEVCVTRENGCEYLELRQNYEF